MILFEVLTPLEAFALSVAIVICAFCGWACYIASKEMIDKEEKSKG